MDKKSKLVVELVPSTCHYSNVRTMVTPTNWNKLRFATYKKANNKCEICGETGLEQGYKHAVECHEIWEYNDKTHTQKLIGLISLCVVCHQVKHIGRAIAMGREKDAYKQLAKVNKWTKQEIEDHITEAFNLYKERSKYQWKLDLTILTTEPYNLKINLDKKRVFKVKRYKKKRNKSKTKKKFGKRPPKRKL